MKGMVSASHDVSHAMHGHVITYPKNVQRVTMHNSCMRMSRRRRSTLQYDNLSPCHGGKVKPPNGTCHQIRHEHKRNYQKPKPHVDLVGWVDWPSWRKAAQDSIVSRQRKRRETYSRVAYHHSHQRRTRFHLTVRRHGATVLRVVCLHWFRPCTIRWSEQTSKSRLRRRRHHVLERQRRCDPSKFYGYCYRVGQKVAWRLPPQQDLDKPINCSLPMFPARCCCCCYYYGYSCLPPRVISQR
jgi:hypothetical protein